MFKDKRIKWLVIILFAAAAVYSLIGNKKDYAAIIADNRAEYLETITDLDPSPIAEIANFQNFNYFEPNEIWNIQADYEELLGAETFSVFMTDGTVERLQMVGNVKIKIDQQTFSLKVFDEGDHWLLPFYDATNGGETYGGGRYINLEKTANNKLNVDFNNAHNFYCAYNEGFVCPVPPKENTIGLRIEAGEKILNLNR